MTGRTSLFAAGTVLVALGAWLSASLGASATAPPMTTNAGNSAEAPLAARPAIRLASRVEGGWSWWDKATRQYGDPRNRVNTYVYPQSWQAELDGCSSTGPIARYQWLLTPAEPSGGAHQLLVAGSNCKRSISLAKLGTWTIRLIVTTKAGHTSTVDQTVELRDLLVVSLGDSLSSGEGNPDEDQTWPPGSLIPTSPAVWKDGPCHRSTRSWSTRVARALESDTTTVTYLNYACSGAELRHLISDTYAGIAPDDELPSSPPQLRALVEELGLPSLPGTRAIDVLLVSAGVNDLGFSNLLTTCAEHPGDCTVTTAAARVRLGLAALADRYEELAGAIATNVKARAVYVLEYPSHLFTDDKGRHGGCGVFDLGMRDGEAHWISDRGDELNDRLHTAAVENGWFYIHGVRAAFLPHDGEPGHGYCASAENTWFRSRSGSLKLQGNQDGTAHPRWQGHDAIADLAEEQIREPDQPLQPVKRIRVELLSVKFQATDFAMKCNGCGELRAGLAGLPLDTVARFGGGAIPRDQTVPVASFVRTIDTNGNALAFVVTTKLHTAFIITGADEMPVSAVAYLPRDHAWNAGMHVVNSPEYPWGSVQFGYRVTVTDPALQNAPS